MILHRTHIRVRYAETDQMRFVYYGKYFEYFEQARSEMLRELGLPYGDVEKQGIYLPVVETSAKYHKPAYYDDLLVIESIVTEIPRVRIRIEYRVYREGESDLLAEGHTVHFFLNAETMKPTRAPANILEVFQKAFQNEVISC